jgi:hypothetical protein
LSLDEGLDLVSASSSYGVEMDLDGLLRMDTATRYKAHSDAISGGWLAPNEARMKEDLDPADGGNSPYMQQQNWSLSQLARRQPPNDAPTPPATSEPDSTSLALDLLFSKSPESLTHAA